MPFLSREGQSPSAERCGEAATPSRFGKLWFTSTWRATISSKCGLSDEIGICSAIPLFRVRCSHACQALEAEGVITVSLPT